jgi:hypothetical protein
MKKWLILFTLSTASLVLAEALTSRQVRDLRKAQEEGIQDLVAANEFNRDSLLLEYQDLMDSFVAGAVCTPASCDKFIENMYQSYLPEDFDSKALGSPVYIRSDWDKSRISQEQWDTKYGYVRRLLDGMELFLYNRPDSFLPGVSPLSALQSGALFSAQLGALRTRCRQQSPYYGCPDVYDGQVGVARIDAKANFLKCEGGDNVHHIIDPTPPKTPGKLAAKEICTGHAQCESGICDRDGYLGEEKLSGNDLNKGLCAEVITCVPETPKGEECTEERPICVEGTACTGINQNTAMINSCTLTSMSCSSDTECCSGKCASGKCEPRALCIQCSSDGEKRVRESSECCPGFYPDAKDICRPELPPFIMPDKDTLQSLMQESGDPNYTYNPPEPRMTCKAPCNQVTHLPDFLPDGTTRADLEKVEFSCTEDAKKSSNFEQTYKACFNSKLKPRLEQLRARFEAEGKITSDETGIEQYNSTYGVPRFTAVGKSDPDMCSFNSLNDYLNESVNLQRNAEIALAAMEVAFSGPFAQDYFKVGGKGLNEQIQSISRRIAEARGTLMDRMREADIKLTCECMSMKGIEKYATSPELVTLYRKNCVERDTSNDLLPEGTTIGDMTNRGIANAHDNWVRSFKERAAAELAAKGENGDKLTTDAAKKKEFTDDSQLASGIDGQGSLIQWLGLRRNTRVVMFEEIESINNDLTEILDYLDNNPWNTNDIREEFAYDFEIKKSGLLGTILLVVAAVVVVAAIAIATGGAGLAVLASAFSSIGTAVGGLVGLSLTAAVGATTAAVVVGAAITAAAIGTVGVTMMRNPKNPSSVPINERYRDEKVGEYKRGLRKIYKYKRYIKWPYNNICNMYDDANKCVQNYFIPGPDPYQIAQPEYLEFIGLMVGSGLVDPHLPATYPNNGSLEIATQLNPSWVNRVNEGYRNGAMVFKSTKPRGRKKKKFLKESPYGKKVGVSDNWRQSRGILNGDVKVMDTFLPNRTGMLKPGTDELNDKQVITVEKIEAYKQAVVDYVDQAGLDYLFKNEAEKKIFASYVYNIHFVYPKLSKFAGFGYPLYGLRTYLSAMQYNFMLIAQLNMRKATDLDSLLDQYANDWMSKLSKYGATELITEIGKGSKNAVFSRRTFEAFKAFDFKTGTGLENFNVSSSVRNERGSRSSSNLAGASTNAINSAQRLAARIRDINADRKAFDAAMAKNPRKDKIISAANAFAATVSTPTSFGRETASLGAGLAASQSATNQNKTSNTRLRNTMNSFSTNNFDSSFDTSTSYGEPSGAEDDGKVPAHGLRNSEVDAMIQAAKQDDSLYSVSETDTLFTQVSKAYKRNLDLILKKKGEVSLTEKQDKDLESKLDDAKKSELKSLLEQ